jgi:hypothetical protein
MKDRDEYEFLANRRYVPYKQTTNQSILETIISIGGIVILFLLNKRIALYVAAGIAALVFFKKYWRLCIIVPVLFFLTKKKASGKKSATRN